MSPPITPTHPNGDLNVDVIPQYVDHLAQNGVDGVYVCGTTGEGLAFNVAERKQIAEAWVSAGKNKLKSIVIQVGGFCLKDSMELATHAQSIGADGIASLPPLYHKPGGVDELVDYCERIASAAAKLPFFYYHIPFLTGVDVCIHDFLMAGSARIPSLAGAKFTSVDMYDLSRSCRCAGGKFTLFNGFDECLGPSLTVGCRAAIGATFNFAPQFAVQVLKAFQRGNMVEFMKKQEELARLVETLRKHDTSIALFKAATGLTAPFVAGPPRRPLHPLPASAVAALAKDLAALGVSITHPPA